MSLWTSVKGVKLNEREICMIKRRAPSIVPKIPLLPCTCAAEAIAILGCFYCLQQPTPLSEAPAPPRNSPFLSRRPLGKGGGGGGGLGRKEGRKEGGKEGRKEGNVLRRRGKEENTGKLISWTIPVNNGARRKIPVN